MQGRIQPVTFSIVVVNLSAHDHDSLTYPSVLQRYIYRT